MDKDREIELIRGWIWTKLNACGLIPVGSAIIATQAADDMAGSIYNMLHAHDSILMEERAKLGI